MDEILDLMFDETFEELENRVNYFPELFMISGKTEAN